MKSRRSRVDSIPVVFIVFQGDRKSQQMTSCGTGLPWDRADYCNSPNKQGPINHHIVKSCTEHGANLCCDPACMDRSRGMADPFICCSSYLPHGDG
ncbi:hypothetical protein GOODEAATRI_000042 [Goodea atripinnis]|uniref:Uncharacterized protein n=1 Tax=Goodea atripinnis TaxID=208336 RepID=A0ABV0NGM7_9TELE